MAYKDTMTSLQDAERATRQLLQALEPETHLREGLVDTPRRVAASLLDLTDGYDLDPKAYLERTFHEDVDEMVMVSGVPVYSLCEHHLLPFYGRAWIAYIPSGGLITGLSKLARCLQGYARRLQVQERLTSQVADAINEVLSPQGVGVYLECEHLCMTMRGVQVPGTLTKTSALRGLLFEQERARAEFFSLVGR